MATGTGRSGIASMISFSLYRGRAFARPSGAGGRARHSIADDGSRRSPAQRARARVRAGVTERIHLRQTLAEMEALAPHHLRQHIGGDGVDGGGDPLEVRAPHRHTLVLGEIRRATADDAGRAGEAALAAWPSWSATPRETRAA